MFSNKKSKEEADLISTSNNIIGKGTTIEGKITSDANIRIEGKVVGDTITKAKVALGESSQIIGNIYAQNAEIAGNVVGNIETTAVLILRSTAVIKGDITTNKIVIEEGASFNGRSIMGSIRSDINEQ